MTRDAARSFADPESVRILGLYERSVRESAGKLGVAWLERTPTSLERSKLDLAPKKPTPPRVEKPAVPRPWPRHVPRPTPRTPPRAPVAPDPKDDDTLREALPRDTLIDSYDDIPVEVELTPTSSGERVAVGPRDYDEEITIAIDVADAAPVVEEPVEEEDAALASAPPASLGSYVRLMLVAGVVGFVAITVVLFGAELAGLPAHALAQKAWQAILALASRA